MGVNLLIATVKGVQASLNYDQKIILVEICDRFCNYIVCQSKPSELSDKSVLITLLQSKKRSVC